MSDTVYLNGQFMAASEATISIFDRGFLFADSLYEVIPFYQSVGFRMEEHLQRLQRGLDAIGIELDVDVAELCQELVNRNGGGHQAVYVQITRGADSCRRHVISPELKPTILILSYPIKAALAGDPNLEIGISAITTEDIRWHRCDIKTTALLANIMAVREALAAGAQEALFIRDGYVLEGASSNLFIVQDGQLLTAEEDHQILGGITRALVLELAEQAGIAVRQQPLPQALLQSAEEVWITSSTRGVVPVVNIDEQPVGTGKPGPLWVKMSALLQAYQQQLMEA